MHAYVVIRGIKPRVDDYVNACLAQSYPYRCKDPKTNKIADGMWVQLSMRPIQLYEIVAPEPMMMNVLATIRPNTTNGYQQHSINNTVGNIIRKMLKLDAFPKDEDIKKAKRMYFINNQDIDVAGIGMKKDEYLDGVEQL